MADTSNPRYSVLLSLHDRDLIDLQKTFKQLVKAVGQRDDIEFCIVFDFAKGAYDQVEALAEIFQASVPNVSLAYYDTIALHPDTFHLDTHSNPVAVNNKLMDMAQGDNLVWVSSDMIVSPLLFDRLDLHIYEGVLETVWCSRVIDQDSMAEYCGPQRPFPMMWCVAHPHTGERHDLELLKGFGYDDNDWMARVGIKYDSITIDLLCISIHQTHGKVSTVGELATGKAYSKESQPGWDHTVAYMREKWGGLPFDGETLEVEYNTVGDFIVLNVNGVKAGPEYPINPLATPKKKRVAKRASKRGPANKNSVVEK